MVKKTCCLKNCTISVLKQNDFNNIVLYTINEEIFMNFQNLKLFLNLVQ
jgi:hypothetical protein